LGYQAVAAPEVDETAFSDVVDRRWQRAVALARGRGLMKKPRFHDLPHTHVAWLIAGGTPLPKIQQAARARVGPDDH
jgi:integrase